MGPYVPAPSQSVHIAVVEDEDGLRELLVDDLRSRGHAIEGLASAEALCLHLSVHPIDIVILDVGLPGEDVFSVASHLRQLVAVGIILLTARTGAKSMQRGFLEGADIYLTKPVDYDVLETATVNLHRRLSSSAAAEGAYADFCVNTVLDLPRSRTRQAFGCRLLAAGRHATRSGNWCGRRA